ncbi:MAG TPA: ABC transporter permease [Thermoanaerobaculia bacterium]|jgi:peptide/nickel transport system permease protein|nr:ABC transporter permease [Thermoanaerobaculia bacterium]
MSERQMSGTLRVGLALIGLIGTIALAAPWLAPYDPNEQLDPAVGGLRPPGTRLAAVKLREGWLLADGVRRTPEGLEVDRRGRTDRLATAEVLNLTAEGVADSRYFPLGSDRFGRDLLSRLIYGARVSSVIALLTTALALTLGLAVGSLAALGGGMLDAVLMRTVDALLAFPDLFLVIALAALFRPSDALVVVVLVLANWMGVARVARAQIVTLKEREFVLAARGMGRGWLGIWWDHLLPNAFGPILVQAALLAGATILIEAVLSFLGLGIQPPRPSWGNMIAEGQNLLSSAWWIATFPGLAICVAVISLHLVGDGLRDRFDPRLRTTADS